MPSRSPPADVPAFARSACVPEGERIYAIGDIHGRLDLFQALVAHIRRDNEARQPARVRLILLGDLIDRGPESAGVVARCRALAARLGDLVVLKGNHEAMMVDGLRGNLNAFALWLRSGGDAALRSWGVLEAYLDGGPSLGLIEECRRGVPAAVIAWLDGLPVSHVAGDYLFVHAGIRPGVPIERQSAQDMLWIREEFLDTEGTEGPVVVHGHSIVEDGPQLLPFRIAVDTGAYRTGRLSAVGLEGGERWIVTT